MNTTHASARNNVLRVLLATLPTVYLGFGTEISRAADVPPGYRPLATTVQFDDLNLASPQGVERLYQRITAAAHKVCDTHGDRALNNVARSQICVRQSIDRAVAASGRPNLVALHASKTGRQTKGSAALVQR